MIYEIALRKYDLTVVGEIPVVLNEEAAAEDQRLGLDREEKFLKRVLVITTNENQTAGDAARWVRKSQEDPDQWRIAYVWRDDGSLKNSPILEVPDVN